MWARIQGALPVARPAVSTWSASRWAPALGMAAAVVLAVAIGYAWRASHDPHVAAAPATTTSASTSGPAFVRTSATDLKKTRERVLLAALSEHFQQTEVLLTEIMNSPDSGPSEVDFERTSAGDLVASGRLYRVTAQENGDLQLAGCSMTSSPCWSRSQAAPSTSPGRISSPCGHALATRTCSSRSGPSPPKFNNGKKV